MTGIDSPYEAPEAPDLVIDTQHAGVAACIAQLIEFVMSRCGDAVNDAAPPQ